MVFAFSLFNGFVASSFKPKILILIWSYSKCFGVCWRGSKRNTSLGSIGCELFMRNSWFCILVRYCNIVTPILKSKISLLRLIAEELWNIRRSFSWWISLNIVDLQRMWIGVSFIERIYPQIKNFFRFSYHQLQFRLVYQWTIVGMRKC